MRRRPHRNVDPTHTATLRRRFMAEAARRFNEVAAEIRRVVIEEDAFGFNARPEQNRQVLRIHKGRFEFTTDEAKVAAFMRWLKLLERNKILTVTEGVPIETAARRAWSAKYIETAYQKGIADAGKKLRGAGAEVGESWISGAFNRPVHADRIGIIFTRTFRELRDVTDKMDAQISRALAQGLADGKSPFEIARNMTDRVKKVGRTRARLIARTEVINAHAEATLNAYEEAGAEGVEAETEFRTAGDSRVCPQCKRLEGRVYTLSKARGVIPVHPNCRCAWLPVLRNARGLRLNAMAA